MNMSIIGRLFIWITILLIFLKIINIVNISWFFVLLPILSPLILVFLFVFSSILIGIILTIKYKIIKNIKKIKK